MSTRALACVAMVATVAAVALAFADRQQPPAPPNPPVAGIAVPVGAAPVAAIPAGQKEVAAAADREAILKSASDFATAFNKGDSKAVMDLWTEQCECQDAEVLRGRAAVEKAYADFFRATPGARIEVRVESVRFPGADLAIEDGVLRLTRAGGLPTSTATDHHPRPRWWSVADGRLERVGRRRGPARRPRLARRDVEGDRRRTRGDAHGHAALRGRFVRLAQGKAVTSGNMRISLDPQTGQLRSWHDDAGGHGWAL